MQEQQVPIPSPLKENAPKPAHILTYDGEFRQVLRLAVTNLLSMIVTLGLYRFWASARLRRYFWSSFAIDGQRFEYSGTGGELFRGLVWALLFLVPLTMLVTLVAIGLEFAGLSFFATVLNWLLIGLFVFLVYAAIWGRYAYMASRTRWRGIRLALLGSRWRFARFGFGQAVLTALTLGLYYPWAAMRLYQRLFASSQFGQLGFSLQRHQKRLLIYWIMWNVTLAVGLFATLFGGMFLSVLVVGPDQLESNMNALFEYFAIFAIPLYLLFSLFGALVRSLYQAQLFNNLASGLSLGPLRLLSQVSYKTYFVVALEMFALLLVLGGLAVGVGLVADWLMTQFEPAFLQGLGQEMEAELATTDQEAPVPLDPQRYAQTIVSLMISLVTLNLLYGQILRPLATHRFLLRLPGRLAPEGHLPHQELRQAPQDHRRSGEGLAAALDVGAV